MAQSGLQLWERTARGTRCRGDVGYRARPSQPTVLCSQPSAFEVQVSSADWLYFEDLFAMQDRCDLHLERLAFRKCEQLRLFANGDRGCLSCG